MQDQGGQDTLVKLIAETRAPQLEEKLQGLQLADLQKLITAAQNAKKTKQDMVTACVKLREDTDYQLILEAIRDEKLMVPRARTFGYQKSLRDFFGAMDNDSESGRVWNWVKNQLNSEGDLDLHEMFCRCELINTRIAVESTRYKDPLHEANGMLVHHPYLASLIVQLLVNGCQFESSSWRSVTLSNVRLWNPNASNSALGKLSRVSDEEKNGQWLLCFFSALKLAKQTGGFVVRPILKEAGPSNMQKVEQLMARELQIPVHDIYYSNKATFEQLYDSIYKGLTQITGLRPDALKIVKESGALKKQLATNIGKQLAAYHDPSCDFCGVELNVREKALAKLDDEMCKLRIQVLYDRGSLSLIALNSRRPDSDLPKTELDVAAAVGTLISLLPDLTNLVLLELLIFPMDDASAKALVDAIFRLPDDWYSAELLRVRLPDISDEGVQKLQTPSRRFQISVNDQILRSS